MKVLGNARPPWGDYGSILWHGVIATPSSDNSALEIERTGPFIPPISFPWPTIVITDQLRREIEQANFTGFVLRPVVVKRVVELNWQDWDASAPEPAFYPEESEPENYIARGAHSEKVAAKLPSLSELFVPPTPGIQLEGGAFNFSRHNGEHICRAARWSYLYISDRLVSWLEARVARWVKIESARAA